MNDATSDVSLSTACIDSIVMRCRMAAVGPVSSPFHLQIRLNACIGAVLAGHEVGHIPAMPITNASPIGCPSSSYLLGSGHPHVARTSSSIPWRPTMRLENGIFLGLEENLRAWACRTECGGDAPGQRGANDRNFEELCRLFLFFEVRSIWRLTH